MLTVKYHHFRNLPKNLDPREEQDPRGRTTGLRPKHLLQNKCSGDPKLIWLKNSQEI